jgi:hypothetical protein
MQVVVQYVLYLIGLPLELLVVVSMATTRAWRELPFIFAYAVALCISSLIEIPVYFAHFAGSTQGRTRVFYYWLNEGALQLLVYAAVISLIYEATASVEGRVTIRRSLVAFAILLAPLSVAWHYDAALKTGEWMTLVSRDLSFCTAILDLALWFLLLTLRRGSQRLLLLSGGLGIQFTGEAIGHSLRQMSTSTIFAGSVLVAVADIACTYVWWQTFRNPALEESPGRIEVRP